jgi:rhamnogalacturonyl hydrolase YesR/catechol 2,3-dioxygenase-like lactoylglutathione lyase family enzyme
MTGQEMTQAVKDHALRVFMGLAALVGLAGLMANAQAVQTNAPTQAPSTVDRATSGDAPDDAGPLATDLSPALTHAAIRKVARKVADWQLAHAQATFNQQWTYAALYDGLLAASKTTGDPRYHDAMVKVASGFDWKLVNARFPHADDMALGQSYMDMYLETRDAARMADSKAVLDQLVIRPDDPSKLLWWWCDALFMAPPVLTRMYAVTGDRKYLDYMDHEWWQTSASLYDPVEYLYFRDSRYFTQKQHNGQKIFWSRGNGWVMGAFVKVLELMPKDYPSRGKYIAQYREMADRIASIQGGDGLWRSGLLDPAAYDLPEVSGSAFFTYSLAWGINQGILDRAKFEPVVTRAWAGMLTHIYADGRLGSIQPIDGQPGQFKPSASYVYGVGGFLLAASEVDALASNAEPKRPRITGISHVGYFVSDLPKALGFWHDLLGFDESYLLKDQGSDKVRIAFVKINDHQHVELFNEASSHPPNMMSHVCFTVDDIEQMRAYLRSNGINVGSGKAAKTRAGDYAFEIKDPDGTLVEFAQGLPTGMEAQAAGTFMPASRISTDIYHIGYIVGDVAKSMAFYHDLLGFTETWRGSSTPSELSWINLKVPDGNDYIEFMLYDKYPTTFGTKNHISLVVPDIQKSVSALEVRPAYKTYGKPLEIRVGKNGKRQVNLFDPDGTRVELMEPRTTDGKSVPSSTAQLPTHE